MRKLYLDILSILAAGVVMGLASWILGYGFMAGAKIYGLTLGLLVAGVAAKNFINWAVKRYKLKADEKSLYEKEG